MAAEIIIEIGQPLSRNIADLIMNVNQIDDNYAIIKKRISGTHTAIERILYAQSVSLQLIDFEQLRDWL